MKWMIASDIHGAADFCEMLLMAYEREGAEKLLLLGDLLYHGPRNRLPAFYDTKRVMEMLNEKKEDILCVRGNCDAEVDQMVLLFPIMADYTVIRDGGVTVFATHGHLYNEEHPPVIQKGTVLLHGHTHVPKCTVHETYICMNPGSVSLPKQQSYNGYMTMENGLFLWKDLEGNEKNRYVIGKEL